MRCTFPSGRRVPPLFALAALAAVWLGAPRASAQAILPAGFQDLPVVTGLQLPSSMAFLPDGRLLMCEHFGQVQLIANGAIAPGDPVCVIDSVRTSSEQGLLGIAVDPAWPARPYVYLQFNWTGGPYMRIARYTATGDLAFTGDGHLSIANASRFEILPNLTDSVSIHNGGTLRFGPDGMLYSVVGDDGGSCGAQSKPLLRGKILRLDVSGLPPGPGGPPALAAITPADNPFVTHPDPRARLVWHFGLRNAYSFHIDPPTGQIVIADVGANQYEELDLATGSGLNFGWPYYEGPAPFIECVNGDTTAGITRPIYWYDRTAFTMGAAIISGGRYRRPASGAARFPAEYEGDIFLSDVGEGFLRRLHFDGSSWALAAPVPGQPNAEDWALNMDGVTDYAVRPDGSLWYCKYAERFRFFTGEIRRIVFDQTLAVPGPTRSSTRFHPPSPSPFAREVRLAWSQDAAGPVALTVHDLSGRRIRELSSGWSERGSHALHWDGRDARGAPAPPGLYLFRLRLADRALTARALKIH